MNVIHGQVKSVNELIVPDEVVPPMSEEVKEAIVEVKGILKDLALTTFHKYREAGQVILDSGYEKRQGKHNPWSKTVIEWTCKEWSCSKRTFYYMLEFGEMTEETFCNVIAEVKSLYEYTQKGKKLPTPEFGFDIYNVWKIAPLDPDQERYPGQLPKAMIRNIVHYYSEENDMVVDPMAGSGITGTVCKEMNRDYRLYDVRPLNDTIQQNDILEGFPKEANNADLVILDPPYYNLLEEDYPANIFTENYLSFLQAMKQSLENIKMILKDGGKLTIVLKPMNVDMMGGNWLDMTFDCVEIAKELGYHLFKRICAPLSTQQFQAHSVTKAKEKKVMLNTLRDIIILEK